MSVYSPHHQQFLTENWYYTDWPSDWLTDWLNSMKQNPLLEWTVPKLANSPSFSAGSLACSWQPATCPSSSEMKAVHILHTSCFKIHFNTILQSTSGSSKESGCVKIFQTKPCIHMCSLPWVPNAQPISMSLMCSPNNICWEAQILKLLITKFAPVFC